MGVLYNMASSEVSEVLGYSEEIVGGGPDSDPYVGLYESVPIPNIDSGTKFGVNSFVGSKKQKNSGSKVKREFDLESLSEGRLKNSASWQQKQVSIKTLEGEFSVTMWASGADDDDPEDRKENPCGGNPGPRPIRSQAVGRLCSDKTEKGT